LIGAAAAILLLACSPGIAAEPPYGVILPVKVAAESFGNQGDEASYWLPTVEDVAKAEALLPHYLATSETEDAHDLPPQLDRYGRQYFGILEKGRRVLVINAFCTRLDRKDLRTRLVRMLDGGDCFFQAYYDVAADKFVGLAVNGDA
jgi:hypothetical protein